MSWYLCKACLTEMPSYEKTFHQMFCFGLSRNEAAEHVSPSFEIPAEDTTQVNTERQNVSHLPPFTSFMLPRTFPPVENTIQSAYERGQTPPNFATPADETIQVNTDKSQHIAHSTTPLMLPDVLPPVDERIPPAYETGQRQPSTASTTQPLSPYFNPYSSPEVQATMRNFALCQELYERASERSLEAVRKTMESVHMVHRAVSIIATVSSEKKNLANKAQQLYLSSRDGELQPYFENIHSELSKTLAEIHVISAKEKHALCLFERALMQQRVAFDTMVKATNSKHEAFTVALSEFYKKEEAIDSEYFRDKRICPMNHEINKHF